MIRLFVTVYVVTVAFVNAATLMKSDRAGSSATGGVNLPGFEPKVAVVAVVLSNDVACIVERKPLEVQERNDDDWEQLIFNFVNAKDGSKLAGVNPIKHNLRGKAANINDPYMQVFRLDDSTALLSVAVTEGHYDQEVFYHHGYAITHDAKNGTFSVLRAFRENYDGANMVSSASVGEDGKVYVIFSTDDHPDHRLVEYNLSNLDEPKRTLYSAGWPDDSVRYPFVGSAQDQLFALEQVNKVDQPISRVLVVENDASMGSEWKTIASDPVYGSLKMQWTKTNGRFVQIGTSVFAIDGDMLWELKLERESLAWKSRKLALSFSGGFLTLGTSDGKLRILVTKDDKVKLVTL